MGQGMPYNPQRDQRHRAVQGPWTKYLRWIPESDPARISILGVFREYELAGVEVTEETAQAAVKLGRLRRRQADEERAQQESEREERERDGIRKLLADQTEGVVYYVRRGNAIKIGTTTSFVNRMRDLLPDEILAIEPGSYSVENARHQQFKGYAYFDRRSEYFRPGEQLVAHIAALREKHGVPDQSIVKLTDGKSLFGTSGATLVDS